MKSIFIMSLLFSLTSYAAYVDSFKVKLYKFAVSINEDCTNMQIIIDHGTEGKEVDLISNPEFGRAKVSAGDYTCIAMEISKTFKFTPGSDNIYDVANNGVVGNCVNGVESSVDMGTWTIPIIEDYNYVNSCSNAECVINGDVEGKLIIWFTTKASATNAAPFMTPAYENRGGIKINNPLSVSNEGAASFIVKFTDSSKAIDNTTAGQCNLLDIEFDFQ